MLEYLHVVSNTLVPIISGFSLLIISKTEASSHVSAFACFELSANATVITYSKHLHLLH